MLNPSSVIRAVTALVVLCAALSASPAWAQPRPRPAVEFAAGVLGFADDGIEEEGFWGGNFRYYLGNRVSVGPEVSFVGGQNHDHTIVTGNLWLDLLGPDANGHASAVTPFVVFGGGLFQTRETFQFPSASTFSSTEGAFTAGGGVRARLGERVFAGADLRLGWEAHIRLNALIGVRLGK